MRRLAALGLIVVLLVGIATPANACGSPCGVAIGLASFFFLSALLAPLTYPYGYGYPYPYYGYPAYYPAYGYPAYGYPAYTYAAPVAYQPPMVYASRPVVSQPQQAGVQPAPPAQTRVVHYPHGRYELRGDGVTTAYLWVWVVTESSGSPSLASVPHATPSPDPTQ